MSIDALSAEEAARLGDRIEAEAFVDFYAAAPDELKSKLALQTRRLAGATLFLAPGLPSAMFNRVTGLGMEREATAADVVAIIDAFRQAGSATWWLHWNPFAAPSDLPEKLPALGFTLPARRRWAKMLRGTTPAPALASDLEVAVAGDAQVAEVVQVIVETFEMPALMIDWFRQLQGRLHWRIYAVTDQGQIVGGGCLYINGENAWLGMGAVRASHRRRGGQGALMARRIDDAIAAGTKYIVTETGEAIADEPNPSLGNMGRCGFEKVASRQNFIGPTLVH
jgi:GNAT superfamily N-acetyltransferase